MKTVFRRNRQLAKWKALTVLLFCATAFASVAGAADKQDPSATARYLYAVDEHGSIEVYDINHDHRLVKTIPTVRGIDDVRGVVASGITGRLYVAYSTAANVGMIYCLDIYDGRILWNEAVRPGVDRLAINPDGKLLYVPTGEDGTSDYINVLDAATGNIVREVRFSSRSHDALFPLSGPLFEETKAVDGSGGYLYLIDPASYSISRIGPYAGVIGPYVVDGRSEYVVADVRDLWGMQVADIRTKRIVTAMVPGHPSGEAGLPHGIAWSPDEREVWENSGGVPHSSWERAQGGARIPPSSGSRSLQTRREPAARSQYYVYIWDMSNPMIPKLKERLELHRGVAPHWVTFDIAGDYAYVSGNKNSNQPTEIFNARTRAAVGTLRRPSEDMLEIDFAHGRIIGVGDQYGIGRVK